MKIRNVSITVHDLANAISFYRDVLLLPVMETPDGAEVTVGSSRLSLAAGEMFDGVHHLAFGILPSEFGLAHEWLAERVTLLPDEGSEIIPGSAKWKSRSLYFLGPEGIILELIAREADASVTLGGGRSPRILNISEVGIGVPDVLETVAALNRDLDIPHFHDLSSTFASMGSDDGLLIVVQQDRLWFPAKTSLPARGPLTVHIDTDMRKSSVGKSRVELTPGISIVSD